MGSGILEEQGWGGAPLLATIVAPPPTALPPLAHSLAPPQPLCPSPGHHSSVPRVWGPRALPGG